MNFRVKCMLQTVFSVLPGSEKLNFYAQKYLAKNLPLSIERYKELYGFTLHHHSVFGKYGDVPGAAENDTVVYEIGCGWDLAMALSLSALGYRNIIALDTVYHIRRELINSILEHMKVEGLTAGETELFDSACDIKDKLTRDFGITYLAPCDSANTGLDDNSVDFIYSHMVFEHIPPDVLPAIMNECRRILKKDGVISLVIDYADHYRTFDKKITPYNFLKYSDKKWKKYNPSLHYVNRLRHKDFIEIFKQTDFEIIEETVFKPDNADGIVSRFPFADEFTEKYTREELSITYAYIVLRSKQ